MKPSFCHLFRCFSVTMEPHCALKAPKHLFKNKNYYHHNANDRFGFNLESRLEIYDFNFLLLRIKSKRKQIIKVCQS